MAGDFNERSPSYTGPDRFGVKGIGASMAAALVFLCLVVLGAAFVWFECRIHVDEGEFVPLLRKTGDDLENDMVLAPSPDFKGPQFEILQEGRHFKNPYTWWWPRPTKATIIPPLNVGVLTRKYGDPLEPGQVVAATENQKGILLNILTPGRHYVNTWAYTADIVPMVKIEPGFRGVVTLLVGEDPSDPNVFVVGEGERGTQPFLLPAGTHPGFSNPHVYMVTPIDVRSQKFGMAGDYSVQFMSKYGFDINVEGTIEWAPDIEKLPELFVKYVDETDLEESGGIDNLQKKLILPFARSFFRLVGAQYRAVDYITGSTRIEVQNEVERRLREACAAEGILIKSFVIRSTDPPERIREQYARREIAVRELERFKKEIETEIGTVLMEGATQKLDADGNPVLDDRGSPVMIGGTSKLDEEGKPVREGGRLEKVLQEKRFGRQTELGKIREEIAVEIRAAEQYMKVETTKAEKDLVVATIGLEAAKDRADRIRAEGFAEAEVTVMKNTAEAEAVRAKVSAFKSGPRYAEYQLIQKFAPAIHRILSNTEGPFADIFERFLSGGAAPAGPQSQEGK